MDTLLLTPAESFWLRWHAEHGEAATARRARIALLAGSGAPAEAIAAALGISTIGAARAANQFARRRLGAFPHPALSLDETLSAAHVDMAHARHVADLSLALFEHTHSLHHLPAKLRPILETAAMLHNVGLGIDEPQHHTAGRELLCGMNLIGYTKEQQRIMACAVSFHRKPVKPEEEENYTALPAARRRPTLILSALLRIADGLDWSQSQTTRLHGVVISPKVITLRLSGPEAEGDAARARKKADLWRDVMHIDVGTSATPQPPPDLSQLAEMPIGPETPMSDLARRALAVNLLSWQSNESGSVDGDPTALKAVRLAARRLRAALILFGDYFKKKPVTRLQGELRRVENLLSPVRDIEVILADARAYQAERSKDNAAAEEMPVIAAWDKERQRLLAEAKAWLGGPRAADLQTDLTNFITAPPVRQDEPLHTGAALVLRTVLSELEEREAAVARDKPKTYHRLRLAIKRVRYTLEFYSAALGPLSEEMIADLVRLQARLGALSDGRILQKRLAEFLDSWAEDQARRKAPQLFGAHSVLQYSQARREDWGRGLKKLKPDWTPVRASRLRRRVNILLRALKAGVVPKIAPRPQPGRVVA
ncbi:MAG: CHAD domain-containing protein [Chloroflexi bacterium]|nr:CHAD domain-containing protein [Chloroflexota bacterium]